MAFPDVTRQFLNRSFFLNPTSATTDKLLTTTQFPRSRPESDFYDPKASIQNLFIWFFIYHQSRWVIGCRGTPPLVHTSKAVESCRSFLNQKFVCSRKDSWDLCGKSRFRKFVYSPKGTLSKSKDINFLTRDCFLNRFTRAFSLVICLQSDEVGLKVCYHGDASHNHLWSLTTQANSKQNMCSRLRLPWRVVTVSGSHGLEPMAFDHAAVLVRSEVVLAHCRSRVKIEQFAGKRRPIIKQRQKMSRWNSRKSVNFKVQEVLQTLQGVLQNCVRSSDLTWYRYDMPWQTPTWWKRALRCTGRIPFHYIVHWCLKGFGSQSLQRREATALIL